MVPRLPSGREPYYGEHRCFTPACKTFHDVNPQLVLLETGTRLLGNVSTTHGRERGVSPDRDPKVHAGTSVVRASMSGVHDFQQCSPWKPSRNILNKLATGLGICRRHSTGVLVGNDTRAHCRQLPNIACQRIFVAAEVGTGRLE